MSPSAEEAPRYANTGSVLNTAIDGAKPVRLHEVPIFSDKHEERRWAKQHMAGAFRVFAKLGYADGASGHISLRGWSQCNAPTDWRWNTNLMKTP